MARQRHDATEATTGAPIPSTTTRDSDGEGRRAGGGSKPAAGLTLVATPIGNLGDISARALSVLSGADVIACEDTRLTGKLLSLLGLSAPLTPYHDHNADQARPALLARMREGQAVALVSDAGTPMISDPGWRLVRACRAEGIPVTAVPGASAVLTALQLSGLPCDRFLFAGFLPHRASARRRVARELVAVPATLVFYESPNRLAESFSDLAAVLGAREAAMVREMTKLHEEVVTGDLFELANRYAEQGAPKGEVVIVVAPPQGTAGEDAEDIDARLDAAVAEGSSIKDAAALVAAETGHPRREVYARALRKFKGGEEG